MLFVWWNGHIDPASIDIGRMVSVLAIAVIGGLYRLEGAWIGSFVYVVLNNYLQTVSWIGPRFDTVIGVVFLVIVLVSPAGVMGTLGAPDRPPRNRDPGAEHAPSEHDTGERRLVTRISVSALCGPVCTGGESGKQRKGERRWGVLQGWKLMLPLAGVALAVVAVTASRARRRRPAQRSASA